MDVLEKQIQDLKVGDKVHRQDGYSEVCSSLETPGEPKVFMFSTPHGAPADKCVEELGPHLKAGDIIIDCGNEHWTNTERRQRTLKPRGIHYVGCGVSGGYQSARNGPSMSPGGDKEALQKVMPFLRSIAAKDGKGRPCTEPVGPGGSGHYVKMVHNGIEQGMMSAIAEVWLLLTDGLGLSYEEVGDIFRKWNEEGPLRGCFLVAIGADMERKKDDKGRHVVATVRDKVVQDVEESEGTGVWTSEEAVALHIPAASIVAGHLFRCASADLARRVQDKKASAGGVKQQPLSVESRDQFVEALHRTTYFSFLACFTQGMDVIRAKDRSDGWGLDYVKILQLWRGGCIIQADHIVDLLEGVYRRPDHDAEDLLSNDEVGHELASQYQAAKDVVLKALAADAFVPATSQTLEWYKYTTSTHLPTQFMEAQLDYFGQHMYDTKDDPVGEPKSGKHHFEWKPAKGITGN
jgi:6-phosphogluconate dehydrogenase